MVSGSDGIISDTVIDTQDISFLVSLKITIEIIC